MNSEIGTGTPSEPRIRADRNESLLGPPRGVVPALLDFASSVDRYPPAELEVAARAAVATHYGVDPSEVLLVDGVDDAIDLCLLHFRNANAVTPGFDGYPARAQALNRPLQMHRLPEDHSISGIGSQNDAITFLASPNNPTGQCFRATEIEALLSRGATVFLDETYADFTPASAGLSWHARGASVLVFRSFSKSFGLAGLRLGAIFASDSIIAGLAARQRYCRVGSIGLYVLARVLQEDPDYPKRLAAEVQASRRILVEALNELSWFAPVENTHANFVLVRCRSREEADALVRWCDARGVALMGTAPMGIPEGVRITVLGQAEVSTVLRTITAFTRSEGRWTPHLLAS